MVRNIFSYNGSGSDKIVSSQSYSANQGSVSADSCTSFYQSGPDLVHFSDFRTRVIDIGKNYGWSAKNMVFEGDAFVYGNIILDLTSISDSDIRTDHDILADIAVLSDTRARKDVGEMSDFCPFADF